MVVMALDVHPCRKEYVFLLIQLMGALALLSSLTTRAGFRISGTSLTARSYYVKLISQDLDIYRLRNEILPSDLENRLGPHFFPCQHYSIGIALSQHN